MWKSIDMERKGCESIGCWTHHYVTLSYDLDPGLSRLNCEIALYPKYRRADWHGTNGMWVNRLFDPLFDIDI